MEGGGDGIDGHRLQHAPPPISCSRRRWDGGGVVQRLVVPSSWLDRIGRSLASASDHGSLGSIAEGVGDPCGGGARSLGSMGPWGSRQSLRRRERPARSRRADASDALASPPRDGPMRWERTNRQQRRLHRGGGGGALAIDFTSLGPASGPKKCKVDRWPPPIASRRPL
jgi:hypothetical protein